MWKNAAVLTGTETKAIQILSSTTSSRQRLWYKQMSPPQIEKMARSNAGGPQALSKESGKPPHRCPERQGGRFLLKATSAGMGNCCFCHPKTRGCRLPLPSDPKPQRDWWRTGDGCLHRKNGKREIRSPLASLAQGAPLRGTVLGVETNPDWNSLLEAVTQRGLHLIPPELLKCWCCIKKLL